MEMDTTGSMTAVQNTLDKLTKQRDELGELWATRKGRLDLCLQLRLFERDALEVGMNVCSIIKTRKHSCPSRDLLPIANRVHMLLFCT